MFFLRDITAPDLAGLTAVAAHLDSVNLPNDERVLTDLIALSRQSFSARIDAHKRVYVFALFERDMDGDERLIGTSMIHAQHGTRRAPHIYFDVLRDERYSETLDRHFVHQVLRIGYNYNGPTEIGGLVLLPSFRRHEMGLGRWLSYVRFLYIALHRRFFRDEVLSELMPPLEDDGTSLLWEALGRNFTGMSYQEADRISQTNKEFIRALFPAEPLYACLLPQKAQALIGQVGPETRGVEKLLRRIGFEYAERIDPFDGGPHFVATTDEISLVRTTRTASATTASAGSTTENFGLVCVERDREPHFMATGTRLSLDAQQVSLPEDVLRLLDLSPGDSVGVLPF